MKNPSEKLNKLFYNKRLYKLIPFVNTLITFIKKKTITSTQYDKKNNVWSIKEKDCFVIFDNRPHWNITFDRLLKHVQQTPCKFYLPQSGDIVIDVGAGVGTEALVFSDLVGAKGKVFAIEAHPETFSFLNLLVKKNGLRNVMPQNIALCSYNGTVYIDNLSNHEANKIHNVNDNSAHGITSSTLDQFVKQQEIVRIDFLKMNIEGAELDALQGMQESIKIINNIAVSCHDFLEDYKDKNIMNTYYKFLKQNNFEISTQNTGHMVKDSWIYGTKKLT